MFDLHTLPISPHTHIKDQGALPDTKRFQIVELPHGLLIEEKLLDNVEEKLTYTFTKRKRSSKNGRIYLLTHILEYEDGSSYYGGCANGLQYFYYYSKGSGPNIRCEEIEKIVIDRIKAYFKGNEIFSRLVEDAVKKRINELPKIYSGTADWTRTLKKPYSHIVFNKHLRIRTIILVQSNSFGPVGCHRIGHRIENLFGSIYSLWCSVRPSMAKPFTNASCASSWSSLCTFPTVAAFTAASAMRSWEFQ